MTVMAIGIMPYISAQIILQLLQVAVPRLEKLKREGEAGQKKFEQYTRYGTVGLAAFQGMGLGILMITLSLMERFRSQRTDSFGDRVVAALRREFGGHAVIPAKKK